MKTNTPRHLSRGFSLVLTSVRIVLIILLSLCLISGVTASTFTFVNTCNHTVWPAIYKTSSINSSFASTGFELPKGTSRSLEAPIGWSGRIWARTGCNFDRSGYGSCLTGDCASGRVECSGNAETQPVTIAEFTLDGYNELDFYDVSLVDGFNLPIYVEAEGRSGPCDSTGCIFDVNQICPEELKVGKDGIGEGCMHPCQALGRAEYCCTGAYSSPQDCRSNVYSEMFKAACPRSYSYAYDDATSTFTCTDADFTITFCPASRFSY